MIKASLRNIQGKTLLTELGVAQSFVERGFGLLGRSQLQSQQGLWIKPCRSIHTFFMRFSIDCIFLNRQLQITSIASNVAPWRFAFDSKAYSVIEVSAGCAEAWQVKVGEVLDVST